MPTERTLAQHRRRWQQAEEALDRVARERDEALAAAQHAQGNLDACIARRDAAEQVDPEALLLADLEAAVAGYHRRVAEAEERAAVARRGRGDGYGYASGMVGGFIDSRREPYRPALEQPLGRALLHLAARHDVAIEATVVFPTDPGPTLVSVPPHLGRAIEHLVHQDGFR